MFRSTGLLAALVGIVALGCGSAQAQGISLGFYAGDPYYYGPGYYDPYYYGPGYGYRSYGYRSYGYAPRTYRYSSRTYSYAPQARAYSYRPAQSPAPSVETRTRRNGSCGEFHYWNGQTCLDARVVPPNLTD